MAFTKFQKAKEPHKGLISGFVHMGLGSKKKSLSYQRTHDK